MYTRLLHVVHFQMEENSRKTKIQQIFSHHGLHVYMAL